MNKILIVDDHSMIRDGIRSMLHDVKGYKVVGEAANGKDAIAKVEQLEPEIVIMDISMPEMNGISAIAYIKSHYPDTQIIALTMYDQIEQVKEIIGAGALCYLTKNSTREELFLAIDSASKNLSYFSREILQCLLENESPRSGDDGYDDVILTNREREILKLIADEYTNIQIAARLSLSNRTVDTHRRNLLEKLGAKNTAGLVKYAIKNELVNLV